LNFTTNDAKDILASDLKDYPIHLTRNFTTLKDWLKQRQRGTRRIGILASSGARRIKPYGFDVTNQNKVEYWFLNPQDDVRSSYYLEDIATEFEVQGLELDWTGVCWGRDLRINGRDWEYKRFKGTKWENVHAEDAQNFLINKYRVLLTRAREGFIIWVPPGNPTDPTRASDIYNPIYEYLLSCGIPELS
jgi:DUF2075 family protein